MEPTGRHPRAPDDLERRRAGRSALPEVVRAWLPDLRGRHVLHVGCGTGEATAGLVALGALVTGVDPSADALGGARVRAPNAMLVHADPHALPPELRRGRFDLVYAGEGTVARGDLVATAGGVRAALRPGGYLLLYDEHPALACIDAALRWRRSYFGPPAPTLGEVVTALVQAGLAVRRLEELPAPHRDERLPGRFVLVGRKG